MSPEQDERLTKIESKLDKIQEVLSRMSVQSEQIANLNKSLEALWRKSDKMYDDLILVRNWQASCPRSTINWMWAVIVPIAITLIGMLYHVVKG